MLEQLRRRTADAHARLERRLSVFERLQAEGPAPLLTRFHGFHAAVEAAAVPLAEDWPELELPRRRKTRALERDLQRAGVAADAIQRLPSMPTAAPSGRAALLGMLYVAEGSTLGGRVIHKECRRRGLDPAGLSFFDVYGADTGLLWRRFCVVLQAHGGSAAARTQAAEAAVATFEGVERWLTGAAPGERAAG